MKRTSVKELLKVTPESQDVNVKGWVRTRRGNKNVIFIAVNDGSTIHNIQIVADPNAFNEELIKKINTGSSVSVTVSLASQGSGQPVEVQAQQIKVHGSADPETYPLQKKGHTLEFLREIAHLLPYQHFWRGIAYTACDGICNS